MSYRRRDQRQQNGSRRQCKLLLRMSTRYGGDSGDSKTHEQKNFRLCVTAISQSQPNDIATRPSTFLGRDQHAKNRLLAPYVSLRFCSAAVESKGYIFEIRFVRSSTVDARVRCYLLKPLLLCSFNCLGESNAAKQTVHSQSLSVSLLLCIIFSRM